MIKHKFNPNYDINEYAKFNGLSYEASLKLIHDTVNNFIKKYYIASHIDLIRDILVDEVSHMAHHYKEEKGRITSFINMICFRHIKKLKIQRVTKSAKQYQNNLYYYHKTKHEHQNFEKLHKCISMLTPKEQDIIYTVFFDRKRLKGKNIQSEYKIAIKKLHNLYLEDEDE